jgi:hypothetical protein
MRTRKQLVEMIARAMADAFGGVPWDALPEDTTAAHSGRRHWRREAMLFYLLFPGCPHSGGEDRLFAFCEAVLATRGVR